MQAIESVETQGAGGSCGATESGISSTTTVKGRDYHHVVAAAAAGAAIGLIITIIIINIIIIMTRIDIIHIHQKIERKSKGTSSSYIIGLQHPGLQPNLAGLTS